MTKKSVPLGQFLDGLSNRLSAAEAGILSAEARIAELEREVDELKSSSAPRGHYDFTGLTLVDTGSLSTMRPWDPRGTEGPR